MRFSKVECFGKGVDSHAGPSIKMAGRFCRTCISAAEEAGHRAVGGAPKVESTAEAIRAVR